MIGFGGALGWVIFGAVAGLLLAHGFGYRALFPTVGSFHVIAFLLILLLGGRLQPLMSRHL